MKIILLTALMCVLSFLAAGQDFDVLNLRESYVGNIGEIVKAPIQFKNNSNKAITLIIRKTESQIGTSQKNYFCHNGQCLDQQVEDYMIRLEPGQILSSLQIALEAGLVPGISSVKYFVFNKSNPIDILELDFNFVVEEKVAKTTIYSSRFINLKDVYPNPAPDYAYVDYRILEDNVKAKVVIHNVLGNPVNEFPLPRSESKVKFSTLELTDGIYFYTLYLNNEAVTTRKLIIKHL